MLPSRHGFTLLELMLVVFLLAALAASAVTLTDELDVQARHELTVSRRVEIRAALLGDPARTVNGAPLLTGFVADMGRLPYSLSELVAPPLDSSGTPIGWAVADGVWRGWRGPYLPASFEVVESGGLQSHQPVFRDGWGNRGGATDALNFGWVVEPATPPSAGVLYVGSLGRDGATGGAEAADLDFPGVPADLAPDTDLGWLYGQRDRVDLRGWSVEVNEVSTPAKSLAGYDLKVLVPIFDGDPALVADPSLDSNGDGWLDDPGLLVMGPGSGSTFLYEFDTATSANGRRERVPHGRRGVALVDGAGAVVHTWEVDLLPGQPHHLTGTYALEVELP